MSFSDIIVPRGSANKIAINFIIENLNQRLKLMGIIKEENEDQVIEGIAQKESMPNL